VQLHVDLVAGTVRHDAGVVENHRMRHQRLTDRLAGFPLRRERPNEVRDVTLSEIRGQHRDSTE
jgi:hypothetical protein